MHELFNPQLFIPEIFNTLVLKFMVKNFVVEIFGIERFLWALGWKIYGWSFHGWKVHTWIVHLLKVQVWNICGQKIHGWKFPFGFGVEMSFNLWFVVDAIPFQPKFPLHHFDSLQSTVFWVLGDLKFKISEDSDQNWSCPESAQLAVSVGPLILKKLWPSIYLDTKLLTPPKAHTLTH